MSLHAGQAWHATDPFVQARPELFTDAPTRVFTSGGAIDMAPVETARRAPGERRVTKRG